MVKIGVHLLKLSQI